MEDYAITLAPPTMEDVVAWLQINSDESLKAEIPMLHISTLHAAERSISRWMAREHDQTPYFLRLIRITRAMQGGVPVDDQVAGFIASTHFKLRSKIEPAPQVFLSMGLLEPFRHSGIMPIVLGQLCAELRNKGYHTIGASVSKNNIASQKCLAKCGFAMVLEEAQDSVYCRSLGNGLLHN